jgi:hypothetical protein
MRLLYGQVRVISHKFFYVGDRNVADRSLNDQSALIRQRGRENTSEFLSSKINA